MTATQGILVVAGVVAGAGLIWLAASRMGAEHAEAVRLDAGIVGEYCRLVAEGRHEEAWERCLTAGYRGAMPKARFVEEQRRRAATVGALRSRRLVQSQTSRTLFSKTREILLLYALDYASGERRDYLKLSNEDGEFRVAGTYTSSAGETLDNVVW